MAAGIRCWAKAFLPVLGLSVAAMAAPVPGSEHTTVSADNCSFKQDPDAFLSRQSRAMADVFERTKRLGNIRAQAAHTVLPAQMPRKNFIDEEIFTRLEKENVLSAPLSTDAEFLRRVTLDLTGRVPTAQQMRDFVASTDPDKRDAAVTRLLYSPEFTDRWTMWIGDLVQNVGTTLSTGSVNPQQSGRNAFFNWIKLAVDSDMSIKDMVSQMIGTATNSPPSQNVTALTTTGTTWELDGGPANFMVGAYTAGGPIQDSYDMGVVRSASAFLGMGHYDCLLCHSGRGHLDAISLWAKTTTRQDAEQMAAFFSRFRVAVQNTAPNGNPNNRPNYVYDTTTGQYDLNTTSGNRPNRTPYGDKGEIKNLTPMYRDGSTPAASANWRKAFADKLTSDPMFARNFANRLWKQMFNLALVDPVDTLDPARLDPAKPPAAGWDFQATHPVLLEKLAQEFVRGNYSIRQFLRTVVSSNAYQLSSRYDGDWSLAYVPLFARHYPRRLEGEEIHDQIAAATQSFPKYTVFEWGDTPVSYAMQLPESVEPRSNGSAATFMNNFYRGNRDTTRRQQDGSILQQLALMNDNFVISRIKLTASTKLTAISKMTDGNQIADEMFLTFLGRFPTDSERTKVNTIWTKATTTQAKTDAIQDLAWACINKIEFLFSY